MYTNLRKMSHYPSRFLLLAEVIPDSGNQASEFSSHHLIQNTVERVLILNTRNQSMEMH